MRSFRRFRPLQPPPVLGLLDCDLYNRSSLLVDQFFPAEPPHCSASAAHVLARADDFTFSFLPDARSWRPHGCRDGRVLSRRRADAIASDDLVVCDPLHRRYVMIPPIPDDLTAPMPHAAMKNLQPFLAPAGEDEEEESSFRVFCTVRFENKFMAFFSSANQKWGLITTDQSSSLGIARCYAHGCFFWMVDSERKTLMLDTRGMKFSTIDLPPNNDASNGAFNVEAGEGRLGLLAIANGTIHLSCKTLRNNSGGLEGWQHYKMIPLPKGSDGCNFDWYFMDAAGRYVSLMAHRPELYEFQVRSEYFVLDLKTMLLERLFVSNHIVAQAHLYASFPPPFAPPSL